MAIMSLRCRATAVTGPPPKIIDYKIRVIGGSRSPRCSALPECVDGLQAIATPPTIAHNTMFTQFVSMTQLAPAGVAVSTIRISQKSPMPKERLSSGAPGRGPSHPRTRNIIPSTSPVQSTAWSGDNFLFMNMCISKVESQITSRTCVYTDQPKLCRPQ